MRSLCSLGKPCLVEAMLYFVIPRRCRGIVRTQKYMDCLPWEGETPLMESVGGVLPVYCVEMMCHPDHWAHWLPSRPPGPRLPLSSGPLVDSQPPPSASSCTASLHSQHLGRPQILSSYNGARIIQVAQQGGGFLCKDLFVSQRSQAPLISFKKLNVFFISPSFILLGYLSCINR